MKLLFIGLLTVAVCMGVTRMNSIAPDTQYVYHFDRLEAQRAESNKSYLSFLNVDSLHCGIYTLAAGAKDGQQPHAEDEIYYVQEGRAKIQIAGQDYDVQPGSIVFVPAKVEHHFHSIEADLKTLVFFSKGPVQQP